MVSFGLILPLGAQNTFVFFQGVLQPRWKNAVPVAIAAGMCDTFLISAAVAGVTVIVQSATWLYGVFNWVGILFLAYLGFVTWRSAPNTGPSVIAPDRTLTRRIFFAILVSLLNPHAILDTIGVIGTMSLQYQRPQTKLGFTAACIAVSWVWFFALITVGNLTRKPQFSANFFCRLKRISAIIMWIVGLQLAYKIFFG